MIRKKLIYSFVTLTPEQIAEKREQAAAAEKESAAKKAAIPKPVTEAKKQ